MIVKSRAKWWKESVGEDGFHDVVGVNFGGGGKGGGSAPAPVFTPPPPPPPAAAASEASATKADADVPLEEKNRKKLSAKKGAASLQIPIVDSGSVGTGGGSTPTVGA